MSLPLAVIPIGGQSNAGTCGDGAHSPIVQTGKVLQYRVDLQNPGGVIIDCNDPVGYDASTIPGVTVPGSAWPACFQTFHSITREHVLAVPAAETATANVAMVGDNGCNWDASGYLTQRLLDRCDAAMELAAAQGFAPYVPGIAWCQGETDTNYLHTGSITVAQYGDALCGTARRIQQHYPGSFFWVFRTGDDGSNSPFYAAIRQEQETRVALYHDSDIAGGPSNMRMVFRGAWLFPQVGLQQPNLHYTQEGYKIMGRYGGRAMAENGLYDNAMLVERAGSRRVYRTDTGGIGDGFLACLSATQVGVTSGVSTDIAMSNEIVDVGGFYNPMTAEWTPPAGCISITVNVLALGSTPFVVGLPSVQLFKNGVLIHQFLDHADGTEFWAVIKGTVGDQCNGTDVYKIKFAAVTVGNGSISLVDKNAGPPGEFTWWSGTVNE